jgi:hypothetical protein
VENSNSTLNIICLESAAFYQLMDELVERMDKQMGQKQDEWISDKEAMAMLLLVGCGVWQVGGFKAFFA